MIAANYTLHLYCDCEECNPHDGWTRQEFGEYIGNSWSGCVKQSREDGWRISKDRTRAFAPGHKIKREAV